MGASNFSLVEGVAGYRQVSFDSKKSLLFEDLSFSSINVLISSFSISDSPLLIGPGSSRLDMRKPRHFLRFSRKLNGISTTL